MLIYVGIQIDKKKSLYNASVNLYKKIPYTKFVKLRRLHMYDLRLHTLCNPF